MAAQETFRKVLPAIVAGEVCSPVAEALIAAAGQLVDVADGIRVTTDQHSISGLEDAYVASVFE